MSRQQVTSKFAYCLLAISCAALGVVWVLDPLSTLPHLGCRLALFGLSVVLVGVAIAIIQRQQSEKSQAIRAHLDSLCDLEPVDIDNGLAAASLNHGNLDRGWQGTLAKIERCFVQRAEQLMTAEHARAGAEVRHKRITAEREQIKEILAGLSDSILAIDSYGKIVLTNTSAEKLLHVKPEGDEYPALAQLSRCEELVSLLTETRKRKGASSRSGEIGLADELGQESWYRISCRSLGASSENGATEAGAAHGAVAVLTDISSQKAIQRRNAEFVSAVSHEMKTPLASIKAYVELLADGDAADEAQQEEFFNVINQQADRLQRLIENLLNLARIEAGVVQVNKEARSLNEVLQEAVHVLSPAAEQRQMKLLSSFSPLYLGVHADRDMLLQAAINLISNAVKYTRPGGTVTLRSRLQDQEVVFEVQDTGVGLSEEDRLKVFEKFYRVKKDKEMAAGTGLGLPLVKHIVEDVHSGRIEVESKLGVGSTFRIILPLVSQMQA